MAPCMYLQCWGYNFVGTLGLGDYKARGDYPNEMGDELSTVFLGVDRTAVEISAGGNSACAILEDGSVKVGVSCGCAGG